MQVFHLDQYLWSALGADHEEIDLYVRSFGAFFIIRYSRALLGHSSLYPSFLNSLDILRGDNQEDTAKEIERLKQDFEPLMAQLVPQQRVASCTSSLYDFLYPQWFVLDAAVAQDSKTLQPRRDSTATRYDVDMPGEYVIRRPYKGLLETLASVRCWSSSQVQMLRTCSENKLDPYLRGPGKVSVGDATCYFKGWQPGRGKDGATRHELRTYLKITDAIAKGTLPQNIRITRLHGAVVDYDNELPQHFPAPDPTDVHRGVHGKRLVGILLDYVKNIGTLKAVAPWSDCPPEYRLRWAKDLELLIQTLHHAGIVWGDAKPHNILVDTTGNLWLIDFGGSYTKGWVDAEKRDTKEGDLQGLERIKAWLGKCSVTPVHRDVTKTVKA